MSGTALWRAIAVAQVMSGTPLPAPLERGRPRVMMDFINHREPHMTDSDPRAQEFAQFKRVLDWATTVVTKRLHEQGRVEPQVFFVKMAEQTIARIGVVTMPNGEAETDRYLEIMQQSVTLRNIDVSVYVREASERDTTRGVDASIVMFHLMGKAFEATITCRRCNDRPALQTAEFGISQLHPRGCAPARH